MWREHDSGVMEEGFVGGDWQVGEAFSKRFVRDDLPGSLCTVSIYAVRHEEGDGCVRHEVGKLALRDQIEFMICGNPEEPGSTEIWCDYWYGEQDLDDHHGNELKFDQVSTAETKAWVMADQLDPTVVKWNGVDRSVQH